MIVFSFFFDLGNTPSRCALAGAAPENPQVSLVEGVREFAVSSSV